MSLATFAFRGLCGVFRHWPLLRGASLIANHPWVQRLAVAGGPEYELPLRSGLPLRVDARDFNGRTIGLFGCTELQITKLCQGLLEPGDVFLDIGANHGAVGLLCLDAVGDTGEVHFFEPQPGLALKIVDALGDGRRVHPIALGESDGTVDLFVPANHSGCGSMVSGRNGGSTSSVPLRAAEPFLRELVGGRPCGAKIDVEGAEDQVLPGVLSLPGLKFVIFENNAADGSKLFEMVTAAGLELYGLPHRWLSCKPQLVRSASEMARYGDFLAKPN